MAKAPTNTEQSEQLEATEAVAAEVPVAPVAPAPDPAMAAMQEEIRKIRMEAGLPTPPPEPIVPVMQQAKIGNTDVEYCVLDREGVTALGRMHGVTVYFDQHRGRYFELSDDLGNVRRFTAGDYYVMPTNGEPMSMSEEDGMVHFGAAE